MNNELLVPSILLGIVAGIGAMDVTGGEFNWWRPLICGTIAGIILGDIKTGLIIGGGLELTWLVAANIGGAAPPDVTVGGVVGVAVAHFTGTQDVGLALAAALPAALLGQQAWYLAFMTNTLLIHAEDRFAEKGNLKACERIHLGAYAVWFTFYFIVTFISIYFGIPAIEKILNSMPEWLMGGLGVAGGLLPALGITLLISQIITKVNWVYFLAGFVLATFFDLPIIATALIAIVIAFLLYFASDIAKGIGAENKSEMKGEYKGLLTKGDRFRMALRSLASHGAACPERFLAGGMLFVLTPLIRKLYKTKEEISAAMKRHLILYNVQPTVTTLVMGSVAAMEEQIEDKDAIIAYKAGVMGPMAGIGDSLIYFTIMPLTMSIGAAMAMQGNIAGPIISFLLYNVITQSIRYFGLELGYTKGLELMEQLRGGLMEKISKAAAVVGLMVMGTALVKTVSLATPLAVKLGEESLPIQPMIDGILPNLLPLAFFFLLLRGVRKGVSPLLLMISILVGSIILVAMGIL